MNFFEEFAEVFKEEVKEEVKDEMFKLEGDEEQEKGTEKENKDEGGAKIDLDDEYIKKIADAVLAELKAGKEEDNGADGDTDH